METEKLENDKKEKKKNKVIKLLLKPLDINDCINKKSTGNFSEISEFKEPNQSISTRSKNYFRHKDVPDSMEISNKIPNLTLTGDSDKSISEIEYNSNKLTTESTINTSSLNSNIFLNRNIISTNQESLQKLKKNIKEHLLEKGKFHLPDIKKKSKNNDLFQTISSFKNNAYKITSYNISANESNNSLQKISDSFKGVDCRTHRFISYKKEKTKGFISDSEKQQNLNRRKRSNNLLEMPQIKKKDSGDTDPFKLHNLKQIIKNQTLFIKEEYFNENIKEVKFIIDIVKIYISFIKKYGTLIEITDNKKEIKRALKSLLKDLKKFFVIFNNKKSFVDLFKNKDFNKIFLNIAEIMICLFTTIFIIIVHNSNEDALTALQKQYNEILGNVTMLVLNVFEKFVFRDIEKNNKIKEYDIDFLPDLQILFKKYKCHIKSSIKDNQLINVLFKSIDTTKQNLKFELDDIHFRPYDCIIRSISQLAQKIGFYDLIYFNDIIQNIILYSVIKSDEIELKPNTSIFNKQHSKYTPPYLPPIDSKYKYTLVIDMDETIEHYYSTIMDPHNAVYNGYMNTNLSDEKDRKSNDNKLRIGGFLLRPYTKIFLEKIKDYFEVVIFTAGTKEYTDKILDLIDLEDKLIDYRLYRNHLVYNNADDTDKDLSLIGRDLNKTIILDNIPDNYKKQEENGLPVNSWSYDINDKTLKYLLPILIKIPKKKINDVRKIIKKIKKKYSNKEIDYSKINLEDIF